jgi:LPXTG-motif cell wall-anchored protein
MWHAPVILLIALTGAGLAGWLAMSRSLSPYLVLFEVVATFLGLMVIGFAVLIWRRRRRGG